MTDFILRVELAYMKKESKPNKTETVGPRKLASNQRNKRDFIPPCKQIQYIPCTGLLWFESLKEFSDNYRENLNKLNIKSPF